MGEVIEVPLGIDHLEIVACELVAGTIHAVVRSTFRAACWHCGSVAVVGHGRHQRRLRDISFGHPTVLVWDQRRFLCRDCGRTSRERHPAIEGPKRLTCRLRRRLFDESICRPFLDVARSEKVSIWRVVDAFDAYADGEIPLPSPARVLAMDESSFRRRYRYLTVLFDPVNRKALDVAEGRSRATAEVLLAQFTHEERAQIETVVIDCHWAFRRAIEAVLPNARVVADKFHVLRGVDEAADKVRRRAGHKPNWRGRDGGQARQNNPRNDPAVYRARWLFAKRAGHLDYDQRAQLAELFNRAPDVAVAWAMREAFVGIYDADDRAEAERRLDTWIHNLDAAGLGEFHQLWRSLQWWRDPILAYFDDPNTNAFAEGITNKIKVMKRAAYGFRNDGRYHRKLLLTCNHRHGPTHRIPR